LHAKFPKFQFFGFSFFRFLAVVAMVDAFDSSDSLDAFLTGPQYTVLDSETIGWHTYMLRMVQEGGGAENTTYLENLDVFTMSEERPPDNSFHNATAMERLKRACGRVRTAGQAQAVCQIITIQRFLNFQGFTKMYYIGISLR